MSCRTTIWGCGYSRVKSANDQRLEAEHRADHIDCDEAQENDADRPRRSGVGCVLEGVAHLIADPAELEPRHEPAKPAQLLRLQHRNEPAEQDHAEAEGQRADRHEQGDLLRAQAFRAIGAVADHSAGKNSRADVMRERIGREGAKRDEHPRNMFDAQMEQGDFVVPGERRVSHESGENRQHVMRRRDGFDVLPDLRSDGLAAKLPVEKPDRNDDGDKAERRPHKIKNSFHDAPGQNRRRDMDLSGAGWEFPAPCAARLQARKSSSPPNRAGRPGQVRLAPPAAAPADP